MAERRSAAEDYITFEVRLGEWVTREVAVREGFPVRG
jgi:hypothetical protein